MNEREKRRDVARFMYGGFYHCPNSERVIACLKDDDKVLCGCGKPNPAWPREAPGVHVARLLQTATVDEFIAWEEKLYGPKDEAKK